MSQAATLQSIYTEIADIHDKICDLDGGLKTKVLNVLELEGYTTQGIKLENPEEKDEISEAETNINALINLALQIAKESQSDIDDPDDEDIDLEDIPDGSPIALIPKLIAVLVGFEAPLKIIVQVLLDYVGSVLLEHLKRELNKKRPEITLAGLSNSSMVVKIPKEAKQMVVRIFDIQDGSSKRFEPNGLSKSAYDYADYGMKLDRYTRYGLGAVSFGLKAKTDTNNTFVMWRQEIQLQFTSQLFDIPKDDYDDPHALAYIFLEYTSNVQVHFIKGVNLDTQ